MEKRGLSDIVTTILIILMVLGAVVIVWVVVKNALKEGEDISIGSVTIGLEIVDIEENIVSVTRSTGQGDMEMVRFTLTDASGTTETEDFNANDLDELETKEFDFGSKGYVLADYIKIGVAPIIRTNSGKLVVGNIKDETEKENELVSYYQFDTDAKDSIGENHGTLEGGTYVEDGRLVLDGIDDYVFIENNENLNINGPVTVSVWVYPKQVSEAMVFFIARKKYVLWLNTQGKIRFADVIGHYVDTDINPLEINKWQHVVGVFSGKREEALGEDNSEVYVDGEAKGIERVGIWSPDFNFEDDNSIYMSNNGGDIRSVNGMMDDIRIYDKGLTQQEVINLYNSEKSDFETGGDGECVPDWQCSDWPVCIDNIQTRTCTDINNCGTDDGKPSEMQTCDAGLVAYYTFNNDAGGNVYDDSGNMNTGTLHNGAEVEDGRLVLDGVDDCVRVEDTEDLNPEYITLSAWIKTTTTLARQIVSKDFPGTGRVWQFRTTGGNVQLIAFDNEGGLSSAKGTKTINDDQWHHVIGSWDGSIIQIYVDGIFDGSNAYPGILRRDQPNPVMVGCMRDENVHEGPLNGQIDNVRIYNKALDEVEISEIWNKEKGDFGL